MDHSLLDYPILAKEERFVHLSSSVLTMALAGVDDHTEFARSWSQLPIDQYLCDGGCYRRRRFSRFEVRGGRLIPQPHRAFFQSLDVNVVNGGTQRLFEPIEPFVAASQTLKHMVLALLANVPGTVDEEGIRIGVHQIRIIAGDGVPGLPTPEGVHRDGHDFVGQVLIDRINIVGGETTLYDLDRNPVFVTTLTEPYEAIVLDDRRVLHGVSPIGASDRDAVATRDVMLVDFVTSIHG